MLKNFLFAICTFSFFSFLSPASYACSCSFGSLRSAFSSANAVFIGKVNKIETLDKASVALILKESGTLKPLKNPGWEKSMRKVRGVTLEVVEPFKGATEKTFILTTEIYNGGGNCGIPFKVGESYLVFAYKTESRLSAEEAGRPKENWTLEMRLNAEADDFNKRLPPFQTSICARTDRLRFMSGQIEEIRGFLRNGVWKEEK